MVSSSPSSSSSFSLSSLEKKTTKFSRFQKNLFKKPSSCFSSSSLRATSLIKRRETIFKKARELSTLCGNEVCVICYGPGGELNTWPEDREKVKSLAKRYYELSETKRRKARVNLTEFLDKIGKDGSKKSLINYDDKGSKKTKLNLGSNSKYPDWHPAFDGYSEEKLTELIQALKHIHTRIQHRVRTVVEAQEQRNMAYQAQRMNHRQQQSNHVPMHPFNYGNSSQIPVSTSALNQEQSLALVPSQLPMYTNLNVGDHSGLLGGTQEPWFNEFQNTNMYNYNSFNYNNVEEYLRVLGIQGTEINGLHNTMTYGYNDNSNTNGLLNQLVQYQTQPAEPPSFQFGSFNNNY